jgi:hypothetical protein
MKANRKTNAMQIETKGKDLHVLLDLYNKEIDTLKAKLLNGIPWEDLVITRKNITELAIAIHKSHSGKPTPDEAILNETGLEAV